LPDTDMNDVGQNVIRPALANVKGASVPSPYGGKPKVIIADLDVRAIQALGLSPQEITNSVSSQNVIAPSGDVKMADTDYTVALKKSRDVVQAINNFPIKRIGNSTIFLGDVAYVHKGHHEQTNSVSQNGRPGSLMMIRKSGGNSTLAVIDGVNTALPD